MIERDTNFKLHTKPILVLYRVIGCLFFLKLFNMKIISKRIKYENNGTYYSFNLIEVCFINTFQILSLNITLFNFFIQILHEKRRK